MDVENPAQPASLPAGAPPNRYRRLGRGATYAELDAAGITHPVMREAYTACRELHAAHGRTYFLATRLLSPGRRPAIHALYGFARLVDDVVDTSPPGSVAGRPASVVGEIERKLFGGLSTRKSEHPVVAAVVDTARRYGIATELFAAFLRSMRMDLQTGGYPDRAAVDDYVYGSAEVIGLQVLPVLDTVTPREEAAPHAAALGKAFQLTNFLRDVAEDYQRGRIYLPADELAACDVEADRIGWCVRTGRTDRRMREALACQVAYTRGIYRQARPGVAMLAPASRPCVNTALRLYSEILDRIEACDYEVFSHRVTVPRTRRAAVAAGGLARALSARRRG